MCLLWDRRAVQGGKFITYQWSTSQKGGRRVIKAWRDLPSLRKLCPRQKCTRLGSKGREQIVNRVRIINFFQGIRIIINALKLLN